MIEYRLVAQSSVDGKMREYRIKDWTPELNLVKLLTGSGVFIDDYTSWPEILIHLGCMRAKIILFEQINDTVSPVPGNVSSTPDSRS